MRLQGDEGLPVGAQCGAGGLGQEGICYSVLQEAENTPTPAPAMRQMPLVPPGGLQARAECPVPSTTHQPMLDMSHHEPRWAGKIFRCFFHLFRCITCSPGSREAKVGSGFDLRRYFYIKETLQSRSLPLRESQHQGRTQGTITSQTEGNITHALSTTTSRFAETSPD